MALICESGCGELGFGRGNDEFIKIVIIFLKFKRIKKIACNRRYKIIQSIFLSI